MTATDAADLVERYWPLSRSIAREWGNRLPHLRDELFSEAGFALWKAAVAFEPAEPQGMASFPGFARQRLNWALWTLVNRELHRDRRRVHPPELESDAYNPFEAISREPDPADLVEVLDIEVYLDRLNTGDREAVGRCIQGDETHETAAAAMGISTSRVGQRLDRAVKRLRATVRA